MKPEPVSEFGDWAAPSEDFNLGEGQVHVWRLQLDAPEERIVALRALLSPEELARADRFLRHKHRRRFANVHGLLRLILAEYTEVAPKAIQFQTNEFGKPFLAPETSVEFNLSHSGDLALVALTTGRAIGVDLEQYRERLETEKISKRYFSSAEFSQLMNLPDSQREEAFYACWTRKEAYIKARGEGLSLGLDRFDVAFIPNAPPALLHSDENSEEVNRWSFIDLKLQPRYAAACVVEGRIHELRRWDARELNPSHDSSPG